MKMTTVDTFFTDEELQGHFQLRNDLLPTKTDCLLYVVSTTHAKSKDRMNHDFAVSQLTKAVENIWNNADCCPFSEKHIGKLFEQTIWEPYIYLRREKHLHNQSLKGPKPSQKKDPTKVRAR